MPHHARPVERAAGVHHAADDVVGGNGLGNGADGVYRREPVPGDLATEAAFEKPPGHAVHGHQHEGVGPDQRPDAFGHAGQRGRLHGDHHQVLHAERFGVGHRVDGHARAHVAAHQREAVALQCIERGAARHHVEPLARLREAHADPAADGAGAVNTNLHGNSGLSCGSWDRCGRPGGPGH
jgi:hypothetical protein